MLFRSSLPPVAREGKHWAKTGLPTVSNTTFAPLPLVCFITNGKGANVVFDTVGSPVFAQCLPSLATGGRLIEISSPPGKSEVSLDLLDFYRRDLKMIGVNTLHLDAVACAEILGKLTDKIEGDKPPMDIGAKFSLEDAVNAYQQVNDKKIKGTALITP